MFKSNIQCIESKPYCKSRANVFALNLSKNRLNVVQLVDNRIRNTLKSYYNLADKAYKKGRCRMVGKILVLGLALVVVLSVVMAGECLAELNTGVVNQAVASMVNPK